MNRKMLAPGIVLAMASMSLGQAAKQADVNKLESYVARLEKRIAALEAEVDALKIGKAAAATQPVAPAAAATPSGTGLEGAWVLGQSTASGEPFDARATWGTIAFSGGRVAFPKGRTLFYSSDTSITPNRLTISNRAGGKEVALYSCVFRVDGDTLHLTANAGDKFPVSLDGKAKSSSIELRFGRALPTAPAGTATQAPRT
ncbi:MAG: hypothetical protein QM754_00745 [Tepidisphaeraceae bacterium]